MNDVIKTNHSQNEIYGSFNLGTMEIAINVRAIQEVVNFPEHIVKMPLAPDFLVGVFNLRGVIIPIINLKSLLKFEEHEISLTQKIGIIEHEGANVGLLFDSTSEIIRVKQELISDFNYLEENSHKVISGAIKLDSGSRILQIINPFALIAIENIPQILDQQKRSNQGKFRTNSQHENRSKCISFAVHEMKMGFEISGIHEIIKISEIQQSAIKNELCMGMVNLRGQTVPIIDLAILLKLEKSNSTQITEKRIIVLKKELELFGLLVDSVDSIDTFLNSELMPIPLLNKDRSQMFLGYISLGENKDTILLNYDEILSNQEINEITQGHSKIYHSNNDAKVVSKKHLNREVYISFKLDHLFGVSIKDIREIINYSDEIVTAPGMPSFVKGVLNLRGKLVTIIDTRLLYVMNQGKEEAKDAKILLFESGDEKFGLIVDSIESIVTIDQDRKMKVPSIMVQKVQEQFENDIKEIVTYQKDADKEDVLIILNMEPVTNRVRKSIAA